jgi:hypothetical protein
MASNIMTFCLHGSQMFERPCKREATREIDRELDRHSHRLHRGFEELVFGGSGDSHVKLEIRAHADQSARYRRFHPLQRFAHRGERFRRAILGGVISRLSFESDPELVALPDLGETVDRPEAHRAEVVRRSFRRLF